MHRGVRFHFYTDDTQLLFIYKNGSALVKKLNNCLSDVEKLDDQLQTAEFRQDRVYTELFCSKLHSISPCLHLESSFQAMVSLKNLAVWFNSDFFSKHGENIC